MRKYVAEFKVEGGIDQPSHEAKQAEDIVEKKRTFDSKTIGKAVSTGVGLTLAASRVYSIYESASNSIVGDSVAQRQFDNRMAYLNEGLSVFGTLGIAAIVNPATLPLAVAGLGISYGIRGVQIAQQNNVKQSSWQVESVLNEQKQARLVKDMTGIRT